MVNIRSKPRFAFPMNPIGMIWTSQKPKHSKPSFKTSIPRQTDQHLPSQQTRYKKGRKQGFWQKGSLKHLILSLRMCTENLALCGTVNGHLSIFSSRPTIRPKTLLVLEPTRPCERVNHVTPAQKVFLERLPFASWLWIFWRECLKEDEGMRWWIHVQLTVHQTLNRLLPATRTNINIAHGLDPYQRLPAVAPAIINIFGAEKKSGVPCVDFGTFDVWCKRLIQVVSSG